MFVKAAVTFESLADMPVGGVQELHDGLLSLPVAVVKAILIGAVHVIDIDVSGSIRMAAGHRQGRKEPVTACAPVTLMFHSLVTLGP